MFFKYDAHTLSSQGKLQRIDLLATVLSFAEEIIGNGGCVLRDLISGLDVHRKPNGKKTKKLILW